MTDHDAREAQDVTQADRKAAADATLSRGLSRQSAKAIRDGVDDDNWMVQAFARHRVASLPAPQPPAPSGEDAAKIGEILVMEADIDDDDPRLPGIVGKILAALANHSPDAGGVGERAAIVAWIESLSDAQFLGYEPRVILDVVSESIRLGQHRPGLRAGEE